MMRLFLDGFLRTETRYGSDGLVTKHYVLLCDSCGALTPELEVEEFIDQEGVEDKVLCHQCIKKVNLIGK
jgi:hypothetical protein